MNRDHRAPSIARSRSMSGAVRGEDRRPD